MLLTRLSPYPVSSHLHTRHNIYCVTDCCGAPPPPIACHVRRPLVRNSPLRGTPQAKTSRLKHIDGQVTPHVEPLLLDAELVSLRRLAAAAATPPLAAPVRLAGAGAVITRRARPPLSGRLEESPTRNNTQKKLWYHRSSTVRIRVFARCRGLGNMGGRNNSGLQWI